VLSSLETQAAKRFVVQEWLDGCVIFDEKTGDTHALDHPTYAVLLAAQNFCGTTAELSSMLEPVFNKNNESEPLCLVTECLDRLIASGLLEPGIRN
jgi:hypothetical protein